MLLLHNDKRFKVGGILKTTNGTVIYSSGVPEMFSN